MTIATYAELKTAIKNWLKRSDLEDARLVEFITLAEDKIINGHEDVQFPVDPIDIRGLYSSGSISVIASTESYSLPSGFLKFDDKLFLNGSPKKPLNYMTLKNIRSKYLGSQTGLPKVFSIAGDNIILAPTPDTSYTLPYLAKTYTRLSDSDTTNTVLTNHSSIYLYGACMEASIYLRRYEDVQFFYRLFVGAIDAANKQNKDGNYSGSELTMAGDYMIV